MEGNGVAVVVPPGDLASGLCRPGLAGEGLMESRATEMLAPEGYREQGCGLGGRRGKVLERCVLLVGKTARNLAGDDDLESFQGGMMRVSPEVAEEAYSESSPTPASSWRP